jgi:protein LTV1
MSEAEQESLVNGKNIQFEYNMEKKGKKKSKKKHTKVHVTDVQLENPDEDYPESRVLRQDKDGSLLIQKLEPVKPKKKTTKAAHDNGLLPTDPDELNQKLGEYWNELSVERKKDLLNLERDSVFKIMRDQQKITCNCSVCDRKRSIIEQELKKLYDTYYEGIENSHLLLSELFNFSKDEYENAAMGKQPTASSKQESVKRKGIMTIAEDLLQNDGRKFLEMMEKLAESRIKRHTELLKNTQKEEEDEDEYYSDDHINDTYLEDSQHFGQAHDADTTQPPPLRPSSYKVPPQEDFELPEDPVSYYWSKSDEEEYVSSEDPDYDTEQADEDETEDDAVPEALSLSILTEFHKEMLDLLEEQQDMFVRDGYNMTNNVNDEKILEMHIMRQKLLQRQLKQEHEKLKQFQDHSHLEAASEDLEHEDVEGLENEEEEEQGEQEEQGAEQAEEPENVEDHEEDEEEEEEDEEDEEEDDDDDLEDDESLSDEPIDEEQQLAEGRAMLQMCATKMLRQSLLQSYKEMLIRKQAETLLEELQEDEEQKRRKEEKKHREREKKKEKKRLVQLQKEEERQRKVQEEERIAREKREEMIRKTEEGRRRKQEEDRKKREEQLRKEEELERQRKLKEEKKRLKEEQKRLEEEAKREKEEEERRLKEVEEQRLKEMEVLKQQQEYELQMQKLKSIEDKRLQDQLLAEELQEKIRLQELQQQSRSNSNISAQDFHPQPLANPLFENVVQQSPFISSPLVSNTQTNQPQFNLPLQQNGFQQPNLFSNSSSMIWGNQAHAQPQSNTPQMSASSLLGSSQQQKTNSNLDLLLGSFSQNMSLGGVPSSSTSNSFLKIDTVWGNKNSSNNSGNNSGSNWSNIADSWTAQTTSHHATQSSQVSMQQTSAQVSQPMSQRNDMQFYAQQQPPQPQESLPDLVKNHHRLINQAYQSLPKGVDGYVYVENLLLAAQKLSPNLDRKLLIALLYEKSDEYQFDLYTDESNVIIYVRIIVKGFSTPRSASRTGSAFLGSVVEPTTNGFSDGFESRMAPGLRESIW